VTRRGQSGSEAGAAASADDDFGVKSLARSEHDIPPNAFFHILFFINEIFKREGQKRSGLRADKSMEPASLKGIKK
jgi:hypothetical protein